MVSSSKAKLMSLPPCLAWVSVLLFFVGKVWRERTFETDVASSECNTGVSLLWLSSLCHFIIGLSCGQLHQRDISGAFFGAMRYSVGSMCISGQCGL